MVSFSFGSVSGSTFAFYFFLVISFFLGGAIYRLLQEPRLGGTRGTARRRLSLAIGAGVGGLVFLGIYFNSLGGFYRLDVLQGGEQIHLAYILPSRTITLSQRDIAEIRRVPSFKSRWQLVLYTPAGAQFTSAHANYPDALKAWAYLTAHLNTTPKAE
jgi:hypothetical protein